MTGQVAAFKKAGVKAILFSAAPPQAASLAGLAASQKLDVPIVANGPGLDAAAADDAGCRRLGRELLRGLLDGAAARPERGRAEVPVRVQGQVPGGHALLQRLVVRVRGRTDRGRGADEGVREQGPHAQGRARRAALAHRAGHRRRRSPARWTSAIRPHLRVRLSTSRRSARTRRVGWRHWARRRRRPTPRATRSDADAGGAARPGRAAPRADGVATDDAGARQRVRRRDRGPQLHPRGPRAGEGLAVRRRRSPTAT